MLSLSFSHVLVLIILNNKTANVGLGMMNTSCGVHRDRTLVVPLLGLYVTDQSLMVKVYWYDASWHHDVRNPAARRRLVVILTTLLLYP